MGLLNRHRLGHVAVDAAVVLLAWFGAFAVRFNGLEPLPTYWHYRDDAVPYVLAIKVFVFVALGLYMRWWRYVSLRDLVGVARAATAASVAVVLWLAFFPPFPNLFSKSIIAIDFLLTLVGMITVRAAARWIFERPRPGRLVGRGREVLIVGAGSAGQLILREMERSQTIGYTPVGILDDDPRKKGLVLHGAKVLGPTSELEHRLLDSPPDEVVIAIPSASGAVRNGIVDVCRRVGVPVKTLPGVHDLLNGDLDLLRQLREVQVEDVLGREPVRLDAVRVGSYVAGRVVLVTGAGGSIGSQLCRELARLGPARLVLVDHGENNLFMIERELAERGVANVVPVVGDIKDVRKMADLLAEHRPAILFHAAAYKHVPLMELNPDEALRNNSLATRDLAALARDARVERFVLVSTDKAVDAQTVMGASKALCEWVVEAAAESDSDTRFIAVRFGNVLGSSGSVIPIFRRQIAAGGPVTVTDPEMTRYFMTIPEAAQLIIQAGGVGDSGDIFVLDMGEPVRILDLARDMIRLSGQEPERDVPIRIVGIRPGEKLHETLFAADEVVERTHHEKLQRARRPRIDAGWLHARLAEVETALEAGRSEEAAALALEMMRAPARGATPTPAATVAGS